MVKKPITFLFILISACLMQKAALADDFYKEANVIGGYSDNEQWIGKKGNLKNSLGFEYYKKFSDEYGDYLTFDLQTRIAYDSEENSQDAFGIEIHNAWLEYKLGLGESIKFGHFDPAFGLEPVLDTHGTLLQTLAHKNIGFKKDWGISYKGLLGDYDYQLAAQLGSGMSIKREDNSFLMTGRISTPNSNDTQVGLSFLYGNVLQSEQSWTIPATDLISDKSIRKRRVGLDFQCPLGLFDFKTEVAAGDNDGTTVAGALAELGYTIPQEQNLRIKMQMIYWSNDWEKKYARDITLSPVIEYKANSTTKLRLGYFHDIFSRGEEDRIVVLQLYCFGF